MIEHYPLNEAGRDFVVGDIHGCFTKLQAHLDRIGFDSEKDRLFSVGDLVDRGLESEHSMEWLAKPWFHAVRGNHEQMAIDYAAGFGDQRMYIGNGGAWFIVLTKPERQLFADAFSALPIAMDVQTREGLIGIIHADCPVTSWLDLEVALNGSNKESFSMSCMWSRDRITSGFGEDVTGVKAVIVGHTPMQNPTSLGNVHYIDTGAVFGHEFTIAQMSFFV